MVVAAPNDLEQEERSASLAVRRDTGSLLVDCAGPWTARSIGKVIRDVNKLDPRGCSAVRFDLSAVSELDSAGVCLIERAEAARRGIAVIPRAEMLARAMQGMQGIAIAGTHGKTTTTALVAHVLEQAGLDPTALVGGRVIAAESEASGVRMGESALFVTEVDESDGSFLLTQPVVAVVTNADPEHLDHYGTREALLDAFVEFANSVPFWGAAILGIDHPGVYEIAPRISARQVHFGYATAADLRADSVDAFPGGQRCRATIPGHDDFEFTIPLPGAHNILNALAAVAVGLEFDVPAALLAEGLATFPGSMSPPNGISGGGIIDVENVLRVQPKWFNSGIELAGQLGSVIEGAMAVASGGQNCPPINNRIGRKLPMVVSVVDTRCRPEPITARTMASLSPARASASERIAASTTMLLLKARPMSPMQPMTVLKLNGKFIAQVASKPNPADSGATISRIAIHDSQTEAGGNPTMISGIQSRSTRVGAGSSDR